jgi:hypothetical protein
MIPSTDIGRGGPYTGEFDVALPDRLRPAAAIQDS